MINLIGNAIKFTPRNGKIRIIFEKINLVCKSSLIDQNESGSHLNFLKIIIVDNGKGIKEQNKKNIFKLYANMIQENKKINFSGIGLGLSVSKMILN